MTLTTHTRWRKMHLSIDEEMNIHAISNTTTEVSGSEEMDTVLPANVQMDRVIADGARYSIERTESSSRASVTPVIAPLAHAFVHDDDRSAGITKSSGYTQDNGVYAFHNKYGYKMHSRIEAQISRIKRFIGPCRSENRLTAERDVIIANLVNLWGSFGRPVCVKIDSCARSNQTRTRSNKAGVGGQTPVSFRRGNQRKKHSLTVDILR